MPRTPSANRAAAPRPGCRPGDHNYGKWMVDVLNGLGLKRLPFIGVSFGGGILLDTAAYAPERISRAALMAPAGLTRVPFLGTAIKFFIPCLLYRYFPSRERLIGTVQPLAGKTDDYSLQVFDATLRHVKLNVAPPGPFDKKTLAGFKAPTLLLLAKSDIFIPVEPARRRAKELLPSLTAVEVFEGPHIPPKSTWQANAERIRMFFKETGNVSSPANIRNRNHDTIYIFPKSTRPPCPAA